MRITSRLQKDVIYIPAALYGQKFMDILLSYDLNITFHIYSPLCSIPLCYKMFKLGFEDLCLLRHKSISESRQ